MFKWEKWANIASQTAAFNFYFELMPGEDDIWWKEWCILVFFLYLCRLSSEHLIRIEH